MDELTPAEVQALHEALDDEYHSWTTYDQVIADFGERRPFYQHPRCGSAPHRGADRPVRALRPTAARERLARQGPAPRQRAGRLRSGGCR